MIRSEPPSALSPASQPAAPIVFAHACPLPLERYPTVLMAHGGGGRLMHQLLESLILPALGASQAEPPHDAAVLPSPTGRLAFTTDTYVVRPLFFPGGSIADLAVFGTVNDLAMAGARPLHLSVGLILEEGLPMEILWRVACGLGAAARRAGITIVTGDTKVVERGKGDGVYINTAGIGVVEHDFRIGPGAVCPGDVMLVNGDLGRHAVAIMAHREELNFETSIESDTQPVAGVVQRLLEAGITVHCLRDLTRGGLATTLNEIATGSGFTMEVDLESVPVREDVRGACEILGFDPLYLANEGRFIAFVPPAEANRALAVLSREPEGHAARIIGTVIQAQPPQVWGRSAFGTFRMIDMLSGEQFPRIC